MPFSRSLVMTLALFGITTTRAAAQSAYYIPIGDLPGGDHISGASDISADGRYLAGESVISSGFHRTHMVRWDRQTGVLQDLGELVGGSVGEYVYAISPEGDALGGNGNSSNGWKRASGPRPVVCEGSDNS